MRVLCEGGGELQELYEFFNAKACLSDDCSKCASVQFFVIRYDKLGERFVSPEDQMTPMLSTEKESSFQKSFDTFLSRDLRKGAHTATRIVSNLSGGIGK